MRDMNLTAASPLSNTQKFNSGVRRIGVPISTLMGNQNTLPMIKGKIDLN